MCSGSSFEEDNCNKIIVEIFLQLRDGFYMLKPWDKLPSPTCMRSDLIDSASMVKEIKDVSHFSMKWLLCPVEEKTWFRNRGIQPNHNLNITCIWPYVFCFLKISQHFLYSDPPITSKIALICSQYSNRKTIVRASTYLRMH